MKQFYDQSIGKDFYSKLEKLKSKIRSEHFDLSECKYGIAGNTFRAYRGCTLRPSDVYRKWANLKTQNIVSDSALTFNAQSEFDKWHHELFQSISKHWTSQQNEQLSFAHTMKLLDLYLKWLITSQHCPERLAQDILSYGYCALDSQILFRLNQCLSGALPIKNPTMGDILNRNTYAFCQGLIKDFSEFFDGTRVLFDFYAWEPGGFNKTRS